MKIKKNNAIFFCSTFELFCCDLPAMSNSSRTIAPAKDKGNGKLCDNKSFSIDPPPYDTRREFVGKWWNLSLFFCWDEITSEAELKNINKKKWKKKISYFTRWNDTRYKIYHYTYNFVKQDEAAAELFTGSWGKSWRRKRKVRRINLFCVHLSKRFDGVVVELVVWIVLREIVTV